MENMDRMDKKLTALVLKYPENAPAPFITAKGKGKTAEKIIEIARENNIPVEESSLAVDLLSGVEIGSIIPENAWDVIANIFAFILNSK